MKKYIAPEIDTIKFDTEDVIMTSGLLSTDAPKSLTNVATENIDVIQKTFASIFNE